MKIPGYYINLDRAEKRSEHMLSEASRLNLPLTRLSAVDGTNLSREQIDALHQPERGMHRLSGPEVGCFLSHRAAWKKIAAGQHKFGAVFEDDLKFADDSKILLNDDSWLPIDADIIKIETYQRKAVVSPPFVNVGKTRQLGRLKSRHLGAGGYILSQRIANRLVERTQRFKVPVDYLMFEAKYAIFPEITPWQLFPAICVQKVRTHQSFLPEGAEESSLDSARKVLKLRGWAKVQRELSRPFTNLRREFSSRLYARQAGGKWVFIRYEG